MTREFKKETGYPQGRPGYQIDHINPLACGGADHPSNLQWLSKEDKQAKDRVERKGTGGLSGPRHAGYRETGKKWGRSWEIRYNLRMSTATDVCIYQLKVVLLGISPMIWRRLLVRSDHTIADLHHILQIAMGWTDTHLHQFRIQGKTYGIARLGGIGFRDNPHQVRLADLGLRLGECFFYDYDFGDHWQHQLRVEAIFTPEPNRGYPICVAGTRACPPEDCGGSWAFMALRQQYSVFQIAQRLEDIIESGERSEYVEELHDLRYWLTVERFDCTTVNRRLSQYACGDEAWQWE